MYAVELVATVLFVSLALFLLLLLLFGLLGWIFANLVGTLEERWARCIGERGLIRAVRLMFRASRMRQTNGNRGFKTAVALMDTATGLPLLCALSIAITAIGVYLILLAIRSFTDADPFGDLALYTLLCCLYLAYLISPVGLVRQLRWTYPKGTARFAWPPALDLPETRIDAQSRFEAAKAVYRLHVNLRIALLSALITVLLMWSSLVLSPEPPEDNHRDTLIGLIGTAGALACLWAFDRFVRSRARRWHALDRVAAFLNGQPDKPGRRPRADSSGKRREALRAVVVAAERQAQHLQADAGAGVTHPTAMLLALSVAHLREHLSGHDSVLVAVPPEVEETLSRMAVVLAGTSNTAFLAESEERLQRFRDDARLDPAPARGPRLSSGIDLTTRATGLLTKVIVIGLVLWLFVSQQVAAKDLVQLLSP
jgi:hypothetical protein